MIELRLLGQLSVRTDPAVLRELLRQRKRLALFIYLLLGSRERFHERQSITAMFWPQLDEEHARQALRKALHFLRRQLGPGVLAREGQQRIGIAEGAVRCDAIEFRESLRAGHLERALECYQGELLPGFYVALTPDFERWLEAERGHLWRQAYDAAMRLARGYSGEGQLERALHFVRQAERIWPTSEDAAELRVRVLHALGHDGEAVEAYRSFAKRLKRELDVAPGARIRELVKNVHPRAPRELVYTVDAAGVLRHVDESTARLMGYNAQDLIGKPLAQFVRPDHRAVVAEGQARQLREGVSVMRYEIPVVTRDGHELWLSQELCLVKPIGGGAGYLVGVAANVTQRRRPSGEG